MNTLVFCALLASTSGVPLVKHTGDGEFLPGALKTWRAVGRRVVLTTGPEVDARVVLNALLAKDLRATIADGSIWVSDVDVAALLPQLATIEIADPDDPLVGLAELGGVAMAVGAVETGGSVRVTRAFELPPGVEAKATLSPVLRGKVVRVTLGPFPMATVAVRLSDRLQAEGFETVRSGSVLEAPVLFEGKEPVLDSSRPVNLKNVGANFLRTGDRVRVRFVSDTAGGVYIQAIERM